MEPEGSLPCSQEPGPVLSQIHPLHTFSPYFPKIHSNISFPATPKSSEWCLPCYILRPSHPPWFNHPNKLRSSSLWVSSSLQSCWNTTVHCLCQNTDDGRSPESFICNLRLAEPFGPDC